MASYQYATTVAQLVRAQYNHGNTLIFPVRISRPQVWLIPHQHNGVRELLDTGIKRMNDVPVGTWLDVFALVKSGKYHMADPLVRQVRSFMYHEGKKYKLSI